MTKLYEYSKFCFYKLFTVEHSFNNSDKLNLLILKYRLSTPKWVRPGKPLTTSDYVFLESLLQMQNSSNTCQVHVNAALDFIDQLFKIIFFQVLVRISPTMLQLVGTEPQNFWSAILSTGPKSMFGQSVASLQNLLRYNLLKTTYHAL